MSYWCERRMGAFHIKTNKMKNKGRRHKSGRGPWADGNCKGALAGITRPITSMAPYNKENSNKDHSQKWMKRKWSKRVRGYFKSKTKDILNQET